MQYRLSFERGFRKNPYKGLYIAIEGVDGSGKSTQIEKIQKYFEKKGKEVVVTSEPMAEGPIQELIRGALFSKIHVPTKAYQHLYSADRAVNHATIVEPSLKNGMTVLSHRSNWSTIPHGIVDLGGKYSFENQLWPIAVAHGLLSFYHEFIIPDITFYLCLKADKAVERLSRMSKTKDAYEKIEKLTRIVKGYDALVKKFPEKIVVIDGEQEEAKVTQDIINKIMPMINITNVK